MVACAVLPACIVYVPRQPPPPPPEPIARGTVEVLSAHHSAASLEQEGGAGRIVLVFNERIDPASLDARDFLVNLEDGTWMFPLRAILDPASGFGRNRSVSLVGSFDSPPVAVNVLGGLYTEGGDPIKGLSAEVAGLEEPDRLVYAEWLGEGAREECSHVVRTHWSDAIETVSTAAFADVVLTLREGPATTPTALAGDDVPDNVVDLCVEPMPVTRITVPDGFASDHGGRPTAGGAVAVEKPG